MKTYLYDGPVLEFERIVAEHWRASTRAKSEKKARCNLVYQYKMQNGKVARSMISIPGKLTIIEGDELSNGRT